MASQTRKVLFVLADYGHDPTETAVPWSVFDEAGFDITFATESAKVPECDKRMLEGLTQKLLGADKTAIACYKRMKESASFNSPIAWSDPSFSFDNFNLIFYPGGHEKGVRQQIDSPVLQKQMASYFPQTKKPSDKAVAGICHGVLGISEAKDTDGKSVLYETLTTALPENMEQAAYQATRLFLGDYYKTYGAGSDSVEKVVRSRLKDDKTQYKTSMSMSPFIAKDANYNYISGRFPPDAETLAKAVVEILAKQ